MNKPSLPPVSDDMPPAMPLQSFLAILFATAAGAFVAILVLPSWLPGLSTSLEGSAPQAFWYLSRSSAIVAYLLLWLSMSLGLIITNKLARLWPGGPMAFDLHQHTSLLGVAFALFHGLILLGDHYLKITFWQTAMPFGMTEFRPLWVGLGQVSFYTMAVVAFSFYVRKQISHRGWRLIHFVSFATYLLALAHGITSGTDSSTFWAQAMYWATGGSFVFLFIYRILVTAFKPSRVQATA
jgi:predicted ferric reductase